MAIFIPSIFTGGLDYILGPYIVNIPAGQTSISFDVLITDDDILESIEKFSLSIAPESLPNLISHGNPDVATVIIVDNDCK